MRKIILLAILPLLISFYNTPQPSASEMTPLPQQTLIENGDAALGTAVFAVVPEGEPNVVTEHSAHHAAADCTDGNRGRQYKKAV